MFVGFGYLMTFLKWYVWSMVVLDEIYRVQLLTYELCVNLSASERGSQLKQTSKFLSASFHFDFCPKFTRHLTSIVPFILSPRYGLGAVGLTMMVTAVGLQWSVFTESFFNQLINNTHNWHYVDINIYSLLNALYAISAVLISFGALIGKITPLQLLFMTIIELAMHSVNFQILMLGVLKLTGEKMRRSTIEVVIVMMATHNPTVFYKF